MNDTKQTEEKEETQKFGFLFRVWGPNDDPGEAQHREYIKEGTTQKQAKERAIKKAKSSVHGIIGKQDSWEIIEVEQYE